MFVVASRALQGVFGRRKLALDIRVHQRRQVSVRPSAKRDVGGGAGCMPRTSTRPLHVLPQRCRCGKLDVAFTTRDAFCTFALSASLTSTVPCAPKHRRRYRTRTYCLSSRPRRGQIWPRNGPSCFRKRRSDVVGNQPRRLMKPQRRTPYGRRDCVKKK